MVLIGTFVAIALPAAQAGAGAAQPAVAGVAEAANSVINVRWALVQLGLDLIDYVPKWTMRRCKLIEINKQCIRPEWPMVPRLSSLLGRGKDGGEAIGGQRLAAWGGMRRG